MATFVLVHGAWQGGWCWARVAALLRRAGHDVFTPTLTGLGERAHLVSDETDLAMHIEDVLAVIACEELSDIVLCGHSYGGMVVTGVADRAHTLIRSLVYLDALVPGDGQAALDVLPADIAAGLRASAVDGKVAPDPAEAFSVNGSDCAWVDRRNVAQPLKTLEQPMQLVSGGAKKLMRTYIYATGWRPGLGQPSFERYQHQSGWTAISMPCGHYVMIDRPEDLVHMLTSAI
ncbi:alpha/beta hydrolase [Ruegeria sp. R13_0]|uniref:alpha/beta fold hydrolase n=1 Tax=Ruegeria sp. R13_0 TaxID=2821099 RepID=UPI001ADBF9F1|nr:alpha/beta hydrolase [Ruegeria sp. R13_0]MBO9433743.1 alpha/beta hydrolase [Ruegeria sp. R13_0]